MGDESPRRPYDRRNGEAQRRRDEMAAHQRDPFAHSAMINRVLQENVTLRERFENRLGALERFRAQAMVIGAIALVVLGAVMGVVAQNYLLLHSTVAK